MATVTKKPSSAGPPSSKRTDEPQLHWIWRGFDSIYRFLASLKLAVLSLSTLAATLALATFIEAWYGTGAVQQFVYRSKGFAILLAFLGTNILCAALIRYPWTKRQTGFVVTHTGLLIVLLGSFISVNIADEGQVGMLEGSAPVSQVVRLDHPVVRVRTPDPHGTGAEEYVYPFFGGSFAWSADRKETLTGPKDPFRIEVSRYLPASSAPLPVREPDPSGEGPPMLKASLMLKTPNMPQAQNVLDQGPGGDGGWMVARNPRIGRATESLGPAMIAFQFASGPNVAQIVDDFLHPPANPLTDSQARIHYKDKAGKDRVYEWAVTDDQGGKSVTLPESDLTVTFDKKVMAPVPAEMDPHWIEGEGGDGVVPAVLFKVKKGNGPEIPHYGWAAWPMVPSFINPRDFEDGQELVRIGYFTPPSLASKGAVMQGRFGVIEIMGTPDKALYYRAFGRDENDGKHGLRGIGPLTLGRSMPFASKGPMMLSFRVDDLVPSGKTRMVCEPVTLSKADLNNGIPACEVRMTVGDHTETFWLRRTPDLSPHFQDVPFPGGAYRLAYDFDRKDLGFNLKLTDFDVGMDPGTATPSSFTSQVLLTDPEKEITDRPITVSMNEPMVHRGWTLYQSNYIPMTDESGRRTGQFMSVFQARYDPAWQVIYLGCLLVIAGTFVQFYMRAGVFTDGGKKERAWAEARERKALIKAGQAPPPPTVLSTEDVVNDDEPL